MSDLKIAGTIDFACKACTNTTMNITQRPDAPELYSLQCPDCGYHATIAPFERYEKDIAALRAEIKRLRLRRPIELAGNGIDNTLLALEASELKQENAALRAENVHLQNCIGHLEYHLNNVAEQRRGAARLVNWIDYQLSTWGASQQTVIDDALKAIRRWRGEEPPRTNFDALTESPERLAEFLMPLCACSRCAHALNSNNDSECEGDDNMCLDGYMRWLNRAVEEDEQANCTTTSTPCTRCNPGPCDARGKGDKRDYWNAPGGGRLQI